MIEPERFALFAIREALGYLEAHRSEENMVLREQLRRSGKGLEEKYGSIESRVEPVPFPERRLHDA